jgi:hypothetical protein
VTRPAGLLAWSTLALVAACSVALLRPHVEPAPGWLLAVVAPERVAADERFVIFAGVDAARPSRVLVRVCRETRCVVERIQAFPEGSSWSWIAGATLSPGTYRLEVYLQTPSNFGFRTVDVSRTELVAQ